MYDAPMLLTLYRYLAKEILSPLLLGLVTFTVVLLMGRMLKLADMVVSKGVPFNELLLLITYLLPNFAMITIPMALLLAVLLAFSRLSADSEIVAMKASGISLYRLLPPVMAIAAIAYAVTTIISLYALPAGNVAFKNLLYHVIEGRLNLNLKEQVFNSTIPGLVIYIDRNDEKSGTLSGIMIQDERDPKKISTIFASTGTLDSDENSKQLRLHLADGSMHQSAEGGKYRRLDFTGYDLSVDLTKSIKNFEKNEQDMTLTEIRANLRKGGFSKKLTVDMGLEIHRRFALPFACIIFAVVAMPLGIQNRRSGKAAGFSFSIATILVYYIVQSIGRTLGEKELLYPALAIWLPNLIFLTGGIVLFRQAALEQRLELLDRIIAAVNALGSKFGRRIPS
jgi:lipopolysaccharide export system permease protein